MDQKTTTKQREAAVWEEAAKVIGDLNYFDPDRAFSNTTEAYMKGWQEVCNRAEAALRSRAIQSKS